MVTSVGSRGDSFDNVLAETIIRREELSRTVALKDPSLG